MHTIKVTTNQFAALHNVDYALAAGFLRFLEKKGVVSVFGSNPPKNGKGKPSIVYDVPCEINLPLNAPVAA